MSFQQLVTHISKNANKPGVKLSVFNFKPLDPFTLFQANLRNSVPSSCLGTVIKSPPNSLGVSVNRYFLKLFPTRNVLLLFLSIVMVKASFKHQESRYGRHLMSAKCLQGALLWRWLLTLPLQKKQETNYLHSETFQRLQMSIIHPKPLS